MIEPEVFVENDDTAKQIRDREIRERYRRAKTGETIPNMIDRYASYGAPIDKEGYIRGNL